MSRLDRVTITGPDQSIEPEALLELSQEFPFVEWGILVSRSRAGTPRFPPTLWIEHLQQIARPSDIKLSLHLCGSYVRELLRGIVTFNRQLLHGFDRVQLNFHAENTGCSPHAFQAALLSLRPPKARQFIFQIDGGRGNRHLEDLFEVAHDTVDAVALFDISGGAGVLPEVWPEPLYYDISGVNYAYHGYAGGLGPHNLEAELPKIHAAADGARFWIDMETHVRSGNDKQFDLKAVRRCLEICAPWVKA